MAMAAYSGEFLGEEEHDAEQQYAQEEVGEDELDPSDVRGWLYKRKPRATDRDKSGVKRVLGRFASGFGRDAYDRRWLQINMDSQPPSVAYYKFEPRDSNAQPKGYIALADILRVVEGAPPVEAGVRAVEATPTKYPFRVLTMSSREFVFCADSYELRADWIQALGKLSRAFRPVHALASIKPNTVKSKNGMNHAGSTKKKGARAEEAQIPWASDIGDRDFGWKPKTSKEDQISKLANDWLTATDTRRPLRFVHGVESNGVIGVVLYQVTVQNKRHNKETGDMEFHKDMIHVVSGVNPGAAFDGGVRPLDILLEVHGEAVTNRPMSAIAQLLCEASAQHHGSFSLTLGCVLDVTEDDPNDIMEGWGQYADEKNRHYYYNTVSGESAWDPPVTSLPPNWKRVFDRAMGTFVFVNAHTGQRQVKPPATPILVDTRATLDFDSPVVMAGWLHKRRDENSAWRVRWVTVLRTGQVTWAKNQGQHVLGSSNLRDVDFELGMTADGTDTGYGLWSLRLILGMPDKKGHTQILFGTEHRHVCEAFLEAMKFVASLVGPIDTQFTDVYHQTEEGGYAEQVGGVLSSHAPQNPDVGAIIESGSQETVLGFDPDTAGWHNAADAGRAPGTQSGTAPTVGSSGAELVPAVAHGEALGGGVLSPTPEASHAVVSAPGTPGAELSLSSIQLDMGSEEVPFDAEISMQGRLVRLSKIPGMERKQYGILQGAVLRVFGSDQDAAFFVATNEGPVSEIQCSSFTHGQVKGKGLLEVTSQPSGKVSRFRVDDVEEFQQWVTTIKTVCPDATPAKKKPAETVAGVAAEEVKGGTEGEAGEGGEGGGEQLSVKVSEEGAASAASASDAGSDGPGVTGVEIDLSLWNIQGDGV